MPSKYEGIDLRVKCPFYRKVIPGSHKIVCEGPVTGSTICLQFSTTSQNNAEKHMREYCCQFGYSACLVAKMILQKYDVHHDIPL